MDKSHIAKIRYLEQVWKTLEGISVLAEEYGIKDIFQDNGAKILQQLIYMGFDGIASREGNDARDCNGVEWELKSANTQLVSGFSTHHHLTHDILRKYRQVPWLFSMYDHSVLKEIYAIGPDLLEPIFAQWESKLDGTFEKKGVKQPPMSSINNPKIPVNFVRTNGVCVYPFPNPPIDPATLIRGKKFRS